MVSSDRPPAGTGSTAGRENRAHRQREELNVGTAVREALLDGGGAVAGAVDGAGRVIGHVKCHRVDTHASTQARREGGGRERRCTHPVSPSSLTLSHTLRATSQLISVCFSSVALAARRREWRRGELWFVDVGRGGGGVGAGSPTTSSYGLAGRPNMASRRVSRVWPWAVPRSRGGGATSSWRWGRVTSRRGRVQTGGSRWADGRCEAAACASLAVRAGSTQRWAVHERRAPPLLLLLVISSRVNTALASLGG